MNKVALVTGGSRGIGREICRVLAREGWRVAVNYNHSAEAAKAIADEIGGIAVGGDVASPAEVDAIFEKIRAELGEVSLLVNNAGIGEYGLFTDLSFERWNELLATNLSGAFNCCKAAIPAMVRAKSGCIVNIASMWGEVGASCEVAYSVTKAGLIGMTKALAKELGPSGIRVNAVSPGCIETDMMARFSPAEREALADETPLGVIGQPCDAAEAVAFLASEKARFITGQVLGVNGGFVI